MKLFLRLLMLLVVLVLAAGGYAAFETWHFLNTPPQNEAEETLFDVQPGQSMHKAAAALEAQGIISNARYFVWLARYQKVDNKLQAGRFALNRAWKPEQVLEQLIYGKPVLSRITIREGLTWWQTGKLLEEAGYLSMADFQALVHEPALLRHYGIPFANAEGFLMPETYLLHKPDVLNMDSARKVVGRLLDTFWAKTAKLWPEGKKPAADELKRILSLASIVEKETAIAEERPRVAGVYQNRLRINMALQADPTVIYGLGPAFDGNLRRRDLDDATNPYNTYQITGLPPGPICSPGLASIAAALKPELHDFLYFVAITDGGGHTFSKTLQEHNRAVQLYLRNRKQ